MSVKRIALVAVSAVCLLMVAACSSLPPTFCIKQPRRGIRPRSYKMKLAVFNFVDQTGSAGKLIETIPDVLSTELFGTKRFELKERAELREIDPQKMEEQRNKYRYTVDTFLVGSITRFSVDDQTMTLDVRAINAYNGTVMYAGHHDVHYKGVLDVKADRKDIQSIADDIYKAFPVLGGSDSKIISLSGDDVSINLGENDGATVGMGALIISGGDTIRDPVSNAALNNEIYVGEAYVVEVTPNMCKAVVAKPENRIDELNMQLQRTVDPAQRKLLMDEAEQEKARILDEKANPKINDLIRFK